MKPRGILRPGVIVGRYRVERIVGVGGMGMVWRGVEQSSGSYVALKEPRLDGSVDLNIAKIRLEAAILQELRHPNIIGQIEALEVTKLPLDAAPSLRRRPVISVLEFAGGGSLVEVAPRLDDSEKLNIFLKIARAVSYIHKAGVIHRDIKPRNVLFVDREPKLSDFGTARRLGESVMEIVESPGGYTAPEQLNGHASEQSDIWSLGALLFYMFTLKHPVEAMRNYPTAPEPPDLYMYNKDIKQEVADAVKIAMSPRPEERFSTVDEMIEFLEGRRTVKRKNLVLVLFGVEIEVPEDELLIGHDPSSDTLKWDREGGVLTLYLPDMWNVISRRHALIYRREGRWYIKDLGSRNKTAVYRDKKWHLVYRGYMSESQPFELKNGDVVAICYDEQYGPYIQITIKIPSSGA